MILMTEVVIHATKAGMWVSEVVIPVTEVVIHTKKTGMWVSEVVIPVTLILRPATAVLIFTMMISYISCDSRNACIWKRHSQHIINKE